MNKKELEAISSLYEPPFVMVTDSGAGIHSVMDSQDEVLVETRDLVEAVFMTEAFNLWFDRQRKIDEVTALRRKQLSLLDELNEVEYSLEIAMEIEGIREIVEGLNPVQSDRPFDVNEVKT